MKSTGVSYDLDLSDSILDEDENCIYVMSGIQETTPESGDILVPSFIRTIDNQTERIIFSNNGIQVTKNFYSQIDSISVENVTDAKITVRVLNEPEEDNVYLISYEFIAPQNGETITVNYSYNRLIHTLANVKEDIEDISADVAYKWARQINIYCDVIVTIDPLYISKRAEILANVRNEIAILLQQDRLGQSISASNVIAAASQVDGVRDISVKRLVSDPTGAGVNIIGIKNNEYAITKATNINVFEN